MRLKDLMSTNLKTVEPNDTLQDAAEEMRNWDVGALPVCDGDKAIGIITDRDLVIRAIALGHDPVKTEVQSVMTQEITSCSGELSVEEAGKLMK